MSEISVTVNGSTTINPTVGNGDVVNVTFSAAGERGPRGDTGAAGPANKLSIGTVVTGPDAAATINGTSPSQTLSLVLPQGATGERGLQGEVGPSGPANSLTLGTVTKGDDAAAAITGTAPNQTLSLTLPKGDKGDAGSPGPFTTVQVGTVTTSAAGTSAKIDTVTSGGTATLNFTIPRGVDGTANLGDETPQPLGVGSAGTAGFAARADHVHVLPTISYANLSNVPTSFVPAAHVQAISTVTGLQDALDAKQAAGSYPTLDGSGKISSTFLPGYVDDVTEYNNLAAFPEVGEVGKLFVARDTNKVYRWSGSTYIEIASSPGSTDAVPEGSTNLYHTTLRAAAAAPVQSVNGKTGDVVIEAGGIAWSSVPTATTTTTKAGQIGYDSDYLYVATAVDTWRRTAVEDWTTPVITITTQPANQTASGGSATFSVTATVTQNAELTYQWQRQAGGTGGWVNVAMGLSATLPLADLQYAVHNGDKYRVVISSGGAGTGGTAVNGWLPAVVVDITPTAVVTSDAGTLTVEAAISITVQPQSVTLTSDTSASFSVVATTPGSGLAYQWQSSPDGTNWTAISGATSATLALTGITQIGYDGLQYRCVVSSSGYDDATSVPAQITVAPITVTTQPTNKTGSPVAGTEPAYTASFTVAGTSPAGPPSLQWQVSTDAGANWSDVSGATSASLSLSALTWSDSGKRYRARLNKTGWNEVASSAAILTVPTDTIVVTQQPANTTASVSSYSASAFSLPSGTWNEVSVANGKFFATPNDTLGGDYIATSDNGVTWTLRVAALPYAGKWSKVLYGNGVYLTFLVQGSVAGTWCATSSDGVAWTARQISGTANLAGYAHSFISGGGGWFFSTNGASGANGRWVQSQDGVTWTTVSQSMGSGLGTALIQITSSVDGTQVMAWRDNNSNYPAMSYATVTSSGVGQFSDAGSPINVGNVASRVSSVIHDGTTFVAVGSYSNANSSFPVGAFSDGRSAKWSGSGATWTTGQFTPFFLSLAYLSGRYVALTTAGLASSNDGLNWVLRRSIADTAIGTVTATSSGYYAASIGYSNTTTVVTSNDGLAWTTRSGVEHNGVAAIGNKVVAWSGAAAGAVVDIGGSLSASLSAAATTTFGAPAIQWQRSTDGGASWSNVSGATFIPYSFTPVSGDNGARYRAVFTKSQYTAVNSSAAILTVP